MMHNCKVLVVDNSPVILKIMASILEAEGCDLRTAEDGLQALDIITDFKPDIIITDLVMPKIDGAKLSYIVRNTPELKDVFLVVLSGIAMEDNKHIDDLGADVCIAKGPAKAIKEHILAALDQYERGERYGTTRIKGMHGLFPREVTSELLLGKRHNEFIFASMTEGVLELDSRGRVVMANAAALSFFNSLEEQILGMDFVNLLPEEQRKTVCSWIESQSSAVENKPLVFDYESPVFLNNRQVTLSLAAVPEEDGQIFMVGILQDITRRKEMEERQRQLEKELQRIQKLDAMSVMASGIAHDFNNLLTIINGNVEMARIHAENDKTTHLLGEAAKGLQLTTKLIRQFTTFSDNYLPSKSRVDIAEIINHVLTHDLQGSSVQYHVKTSADLWSADLDSDLMLQVFHNIIQNSVEAVGESGTITVRLDNVDGVEEAERKGQPVPDGRFIRVAFHDTGPGIEEKLLDQIFDPYSSTKQKGAQKGMGLGLTIVHAIVKKHGGLVWIDSKPGQGCTVYLYLPAGNWTDRISGDVESAEGPRRVLVMDDDEMMRIINKKMFEHFNCNVKLAEDGKTAVRLFQQAVDEGKRF
ncbi:MAG: response regulator, partial [Desulfobulbaceae bacterium]|nr:response regulator [Desulfobulbaceae bacterium]